MSNLKAMAEKYSEKVAKGFNTADIEMLARICNAMKKADNKLASLASAEASIKAGLRRVYVCVVERHTMTLVAVKSYFVTTTFEAKDLISADYSDALAADDDLFVMKY